MARRPFSDEQAVILRNILSGAHPSPGAEFLGWPQHGKTNPKFLAIVMREDMNEIRLAAARLKEMRRKYRLAAKRRAKNA